MVNANINGGELLEVLKALNPSVLEDIAAEVRQNMPIAAKEERNKMVMDTGDIHGADQVYIGEVSRVINVATRKVLFSAVADDRTRKLCKEALKASAESGALEMGDGYHAYLSVMPETVSAHEAIKVHESALKRLSLITAAAAAGHYDWLLTIPRCDLSKDTIASRCIKSNLLLVNSVAVSGEEVLEKVRYAKEELANIVHYLEGFI